MTEEVLFRLFEQATTAIVIYREQTGISYANPHALVLLNAEKDDIYLQSLEYLFPNHTNKSLKEWLQKRKKTFFLPNASLHLKNGTHLAVDLSVYTLSCSSSEQRTLQINIYTRKAHFAKDSSYDQAEGLVPKMDTNKLLHVLRRQTDMPLHALDSLLHRLLQMSPRTDQLPFLHSMLQSGEQLKSTIHDVLLYTDLFYGKYHPKPVETFHLRFLTEHLKEVYLPKAAVHDNALIIETSNNLSDRYQGNIEEVKHILSKLLDNAVRFTREGKIKMLIQEHSREQGQVMLSFVVEDNGVGITPENIDKAIDPFVSWQAPWEQENLHSGLGLAIVDLLSRSCGGSLSLQIHSGHTKVAVTLPFLPVQNPDIKSALVKVQEKKPLKGLRLLYVEDLLPNHFLMEGLCAIWQVSLDTVYNGKEALNRLFTNSYDIILMDLNMPLMNGYDTSLQIRRLPDPQNQSVPIIAVTGSVNYDTEQSVRACGMNDILSKPIKPEELYQKLTSYSGS